MNSLFPQDLCAALMLSFAHFLWIGTLIALVAAAAARRQSTAAARYGAWLSGLIAMALCPLITLIVLQSLPTAAPIVAEIQPPVVPAAPEQLVDADHIPAAVGPRSDSPPLPTGAAPTEEPTRDSILPDEADASRRELARPVSAPSEAVWWRDYAPLVMSLYLIGVALMGLRLTLGLWGGRRLRHEAELITDVSLLNALQRQADALGMTFFPTLGYCEQIVVPTVLGILKPMILLPVSLSSGLTPEQIESVLAHELAHLRRYDHVVNLLQRVIESLLFFHPAIWWVSRRIRDEREHCCDDLVIACGAVPLDFATSLLRVAELSREAEQQRSRNQHRTFTAVSLLATGERPSTLRQRIARLLGYQTEMNVRAVHPWLLFCLVTCCLGAVWVLTSMTWIVLAEINRDRSKSVIVVEWSVIVDDDVAARIRKFSKEASPGGLSADEIGLLHVDAESLRSVIAEQKAGSGYFHLKPHVFWMKTLDPVWQHTGMSHIVSSNEFIDHGSEKYLAQWTAFANYFLEQEDGRAHLEIKFDLRGSVHDYSSQANSEKPRDLKGSLKIDELLGDGRAAVVMASSGKLSSWKPNLLVIYEAIQVPTDQVDIFDSLTNANEWIKKGAAGTKEHVNRVVEWRSRSKRDIFAADPKWTRDLPNGGHVQLVGIGRPQDANRIWWTPDGEPLSSVGPCDQLQSSDEMLAIVRLWETGASRRPQVSLGMRHHGGVFDVPDSFAGASGSQLIVVPVVIDKVTGTTSLNIGAGFGRWTAETTIGKAKDSATMLSGVEIKTQQAHSSKSVDASSPPKLINTTSTAFRWQPTRDFEFTAAAVTTSGQQLDSLWSPMVYPNESPNTINGAAHFDHSVPPADIKHFLIKSRPVIWTEFTGFAVEPAAALNPPLEFTAIRKAEQQEMRPKPVIGRDPELTKGTGRDSVMSWSSDSKHLFTQGVLLRLMRWEQSGEKLKSVASAVPDGGDNGWFAHAYSIAASNKSGLIALGTNRGTVQFWDGDSLTFQKQIVVEPDNPVYATYGVAISPDEKLLAEYGASAHLYEIATMKRVCEFGKREKNRTSSLVFSPDGRTLAALNFAGELTLWSIPDGTLIGEWSLKDIGEKSTVQWSRDGNIVAVVSDGQIVFVKPTARSAPRIVVAPDEVLLMTPKNLGDGNGISRRIGLKDGIAFAGVMALAPDFKTAASVKADSSVALWDVETRTVISNLAPPPNALDVEQPGLHLKKLMFSPNGRQLACAAGGDVVVWTLTDAGLATVGEEPKRAAAELPEGRSVEFVGITKNTAPAKEGWKPDGRPIGEVGYWPSTIVLHSKHTSATYVENGPHPEPDAEAIDLLVRLRGLKSQPSLAFDLATNGVSYPHLPLKDPYELRISTRRRGEPPPGSQWSIPDGEVRIGLTDEPWGKWLQISPEGKALNPLTDADLYRSSYEQVQIERVESHERAPNKQALVLRQPKNSSSLYAFEIRGIDEDGKPQWVLEWEGRGVEGTELKESRWGLAHEEKKPLARYEFRLRPYHHFITFTGVSLETGKPSEVKVSVKSLPTVARFAPPSREAVRGLDLSKVKVLGYREAMRQTPDLHVPDPQEPDSWTRPKNVFPMPLGEHTWLKYPAGSGHFYIEHRADGSPESEQQYGPIEGDPFEVLKLEELLREQLRPRVNSVGGDPRYRLRLMFRTGEPGLIRRAWSLTEPHLARKFEDRNEQGLFARLELLEIAREALQKEAAAFRKPVMLELAAQIQAAVSAAEASIDALNDSVADENYESRTYLQPKIVAKLPDVLWGKPVDGLRLGLVPRDWQPDIDWYALPADASLPTSVTAQPGQELRYQLIVENVSDHEIKLSGYVVGEEMARSVEVLDQKGQPASIDSLHTTIPHFRSYWRLKPGERQMLMMPAVYFEPASPDGASKGLGYHVSAGKGRYSLRCSIWFGDLDNERHRHVPGKSEWIGKLTTGSQTVTVDVAGAGRGSPDPAPTAGLLNSDEATNPKNNSTIASQSNPAAELPEIELLRKLVRGGKIDTNTINASITLVAARGATDTEFARLVLAEFEKSCEGGDRTSQSRRHLLAVLTDIFEAWSSSSWRSQLSRFNPDDQPQSATPQVDAKLRREMLARVVQHGYETDRSEIANVSLAVRQLHHPVGREFLRDVLRDPGSKSDPFAPSNPPQTVPQQQPQATPTPKSNSEAPTASRWKDNTGGGWTDAKFVAAVGLAELGEAEGIDWLLARAQPNKFGIDASLWSFPHLRDPRGSLLESSRLALADLFGLPAQVTATELADWWRTNRAKFTARPAMLKPRAGRGSPDPALTPTAGLPNSDEETNPPNNVNGDLRSNPAAGSGDPRRAQDNSGGPSGLRTMREPSFRLPGHSNITGLGFDNNSTELVAVSTYHSATIRRWDLVGMKLRSDIMLSSDRHLRPFREGSFKLSGDGRRVIAATDEYVGIWNTSTGELLKKLPFPTKSGIYDCGIDKLDCTSDLSVIVGNWAMPGRLTLAYDAQVMIWDGNSGKLLQTVIDKNATDLKSIDLSSDGKLLATTNGGGAKVWETSTGKLVRSFPNDNKGRKHTDPEVSDDATRNVWCVQFSPDGKQVAMGDILGVKLLDVASGKLLQLLEGPHRYGLGTLVFSKDGRLLARTGTGDRVEGDKTSYVVPVWSAQTGEKLFELHTESNAGAFSDDNKQFAVGVSDWELALAVFQLSGTAANTTQLAPESTQDKVGGVGTHYRGQEAEKFIDKWKPVWGEPRHGIRYGIAMTTPQRQFRVGERVPLVVFFRNASDKPLKIDTRPDFLGNTPKVVDANGAAVGFEKIPLLGGNTAHYVETLEPGEAVGPLYLNFGLGENPRPGQQNWTPFWKSPVTGKYRLTHSVPINVAGQKDGEPSKRNDITTGTIELEIVDDGKLDSNAQAGKPTTPDLNATGHSKSDRDELKQVFLKSDPLAKYGDQLAVSWVHTGDHRSWDDSFRIAVLKDGTVIAAGDSNRNRECQIKLTAAQFDQLLKGMDEVDHCFDLIPDGEHVIKPGQPYNRWDHGADWLRIRRGQKEIHVGLVGNWIIGQEEQIPGISVLRKVMARLFSLIAVTRAGGWDEIERLLPMANVALKQTFPQLPPLTAKDFSSSERFQYPARSLYFRQQKPDGEKFGVELERRDDGTVNLISVWDGEDVQDLDKPPVVRGLDLAKVPVTKEWKEMEKLRVLTEQGYTFKPEYESHEVGPELWLCYLPRERKFFIEHSNNQRRKLYGPITGSPHELLNPPPAPVKPAKPQAELSRQPWSVSGRVVDGDGKPMTGVTVSASTGIGSLAGGSKGETDADGRYEFTFGPGIRAENDEVQLQVATIAAHKAGFFEKNLSRQGDLLMARKLPDKLDRVGKTEKDILLPDQPRQLDFVMLPAARLAGTLIDQNDKPLVGYGVSLTGEHLPPSASVIGSVKTDEQGRFALADIPTGYSFQILVEPAKREPPWNAWASGPFDFQVGGGDEFFIRQHGREVAANRFELQVFGEGANWKEALRIGGFHQKLEPTGDYLTGESRLHAATIRLTLNPPTEAFQKWVSGLSENLPQHWRFPRIEDGRTVVMTPGMYLGDEQRPHVVLAFTDDKTRPKVRWEREDEQYEYLGSSPRGHAHLFVSMRIAGDPKQTSLIKLFDWPEAAEFCKAFVKEDRAKVEALKDQADDRYYAAHHWGPITNGLRTRWVVHTREPVVGQRLSVGLEVTNFSSEPRTFRMKQVHPWRSWQLLGPDGQPVAFRKGEPITSDDTYTLTPQNSFIAFSGTDLSQLFDTAKPGRYSLTFTGKSVRDVADDLKADIPPDQALGPAKDFVVELAAATTDPKDATSPNDATAKNSEQRKEFVGRVIDAEGKPVAEAEVSMFVSEGKPDETPPKRVQTAKTDASGLFQLTMPTRESSATVWATAAGKGIGVRPVAARGAPPNAEGLPDESVSEGSPERFVIRLQTNAGSVRVIDPANKPVAGAKVSVRLMRTFRLPYDKQKLAAWYEKKTGQPIDAILATWMEPSHFDVPPVEFKSLFEGGTDEQGMVVLPGVASDQIRVLLIETENFGRQAVSLDSLYEGKPDGYVFRLSPVGRLEGEVSVDPRVLAAGFKLDGFKLSFKTSMPNVARKQVEKRLEEVDRRNPPDDRDAYPHVEGRADVVLDASGRFSIPMIATGFVELIDPLPQDSAFYVDLLRNVRLEAGKTVSLKIPVHKGVLVRGIIRKRGSHEPVAGRSVNLTSFPEAHFRTQRIKYVRTDEAGRFEGHVQPGLLEYWLNGAVDGFTTVYAFEHGHARASSGMHYRVPDNVDGAELPPLELVPVKTRTGRLLDEKGNAADPNWDVFGYPTESRWQSAHGKTTKEGEFTLSFPEPYPPTSFVARQDSWRAKPNSDMRRHALKIVSEDPFVVQMTGKDRTSPALMADGSPSTVEASPGMKQTRKERLATHDREAAKKLVGDWKLTFPKGFVYQTNIEQRPDGLLKLSGAVALNGVYAFSRNRLELMETFNDGARDFAWKLQDDGTLKLIEEDHSAGAEYVGALLSRAGNAPQPSQAVPTSKKPPANKPKENEDGPDGSAQLSGAAVKQQGTPFCGSVLRVDRTTGIVVIDRGERDGLTLREKFDIYPKTTKVDGFQPSHGIAQIEVTRILGAVSAEARIVLSDEAPGVGDLLYSSTWKPRPEPKPGRTGHGVVLSVKGRVTLDGPRPQAEPLVKANPAARGPRVDVADESLVIGDDGGIANVAIYLKKAPHDWKPSGWGRDAVEIESDALRFSPRMSFVRAGQPMRLVVTANEPDNFLVHPVRSNAFNILVRANATHDLTAPFAQPETLPFAVQSNIHPWQRAWLIVLDHPFAAITDADGRFEIRDLPAGEHHFIVWHERRGYLNKDLVIRVEHGQVTEVELKYTAEQLARRENVPIRPQPNAATPSAASPVGVDATKQRAARVKANDRDAAAKLVGRWVLTLPADFVYQAEFTQLEDGCLKLSGKKGNNLFGKFAMKGDRLELVEPTDQGIIDLVWQV